MYDSSHRNDDDNSDNEYIYGLPWNADRAIRLDASTGESELVGPEVRGLDSYLAAVVVDHCVYGIPFSARHIMRINGNTGDVDLTGPELPSAGKWACAGVVGRVIYALPCCAKQVLRIDCSTGAVDFIGPDLGSRWFKYQAAVVVDSCIYAPPLNAERALRVNGGTGEVELIGPDLGNGSWKYKCAAGVGQHVYALPSDGATRVLRITHGTGDCGLVGPEVRNAYCAAAALGGCVYGFQYGGGDTVAQVLRVRGSSGEVDFIGSRVPVALGWATAVVGRCVYGLPQRISRRSDLFRVGEGGEVDMMRLNGRVELANGYVTQVLNQRIYAFPLTPGHVIGFTPSPTSSPHVKRLINRWGADMANVLTGTHSFYPDSFVPAHTAAECMDHLTFPRQADVVQFAREYAAANHPRERCGDVMVIHAYTQESELFKEVTGSMRRRDSESLPKWREYIYHLERALLRQPLFEGDVYRGISVRVPPSVYMPGTDITWQSFTSATQRVMVILEQEFVKIEAGDKLSGTIFVVKSVSARQVRDASHMPDEDEVVFKPNTHFQVLEAVTDMVQKRALLPDLAMYDLAMLVVYRLEELT